MAKKEKKKKKEEEEELIFDLQFENFCDVIGINYKKGMFLLNFGQAVYEPRIIIARIWIDSESLKELYEFIGETIEEYEKNMEK